MRAALAPVIGLFGVLAAFTAGAGVELGREAQTGDGPDVNAPARYAAETLSRTGCFKVGTGPCQGYRIVATGTGGITAADTSNIPYTAAAVARGSQMSISTMTDILLPQGVYYVRYDFDGAFLAEDLTPADLQVEVRDSGGNLAGAAAAAAVAYRGQTTNNSVIFQLAAAELHRPSVLTLDLSGMESEDQTGTTVDETNPGFAQIYVTRTGSITATVSVHASLTAAVDGTGALYSASGTIAQIDQVVGGSITSMSDTADVSTGVEEGGPFRRFVPGGMGEANSGVLGKTTTWVYKGRLLGSPGVSARNAWDRGYRNANTGGNVADTIVGSLSARATSDAGNFAVATKNGGPIVNGPGKPTVRKPWMVSSTAACGNGGLELGIVGGIIETYQRAACPTGSAADCNGDPDGDGPLKASDLTPAGIESANVATGTAGTAVGDNYFCVKVDGNTDPIPEIGDPMNPASYALVITPNLANAANHPFKPGAIAKDVGAIDRNGTTVHLPYLTTNPEVDQRLVLVNRGADAVAFWIEDDSFNLEAGTTLMSNSLSVDMVDEMIPGDGRLVLRTVDNIEFMGQERGAATVNVAAPTRDIDVMTIQRSPATGEVDTTVYQHAGP